MELSFEVFLFVILSCIVDARMLKVIVCLFSLKSKVTVSLFGYD